MSSGLMGQAVALFAVTNIDDIIVLTVFFGKTASGRAGALQVILGQFLGFAGILAVVVVGALGAGLLPAAAIPYLGLLPLLGHGQTSAAKSRSASSSSQRPSLIQDPESEIIDRVVTTIHGHARPQAVQGCSEHEQRHHHEGRARVHPPLPCLPAV